MKKKLALILSIVLALSVAICIFVFSASAEELPYAETQAANLWGSSEITKATSVTVGSTVIDLTADGSGSITEGGTYAGGQDVDERLAFGLIGGVQFLGYIVDGGNGNYGVGKKLQRTGNIE